MTKQEKKYWDIIVKVVERETGKATYETYTQASGPDTTSHCMKQSFRSWLNGRSGESGTHLYFIEDFGPSGSFDHKIERLTQGGRVVSRNHTHQPR